MSRAPLAARNAKEVAVRGEDGGEAGKATPKRLAAVEGETKCEEAGKESGEADEVDAVGCQ